MEQYYENNFKSTKSPILIVKRSATQKSLGCMINIHEYVEFYYVIKGGVKIFCSGMTQWAYGGDVAFINWCQPHRSLSFLDDTVYYNIQFDLNALTCGDSDLFQTKYVAKLISDMEHFQPLFRQDQIINAHFHSLIDEYENESFTRELRMQSAICNIIAYIIDSRNEGQKQNHCKLNPEEGSYSKKIIQYIYSHYQDEITLDHISKYLGISCSYMCRIFKKFTGTTIMDFVNQIRCKRALILMKGGCLMAQASAAAGYNDYTYFSRVFKKIYGVSPRKLIKGASTLRNDV